MRDVARSPGTDGAPTADDRMRAVSLTPRERQVLRAISRGLSNERIASELALSQRTVRNYASRVYAKIGAANRIEALLWCTRASDPAGWTA